MFSPFTGQPGHPRAQGCCSGREQVQGLLPIETSRLFVLGGMITGQTYAELQIPSLLDVQTGPEKAAFMGHASPKGQTLIPS